ncbi:MAG: hypothetical protein BWK76_03455 [Desulfobulbaceae bacterium A2]|nr:MAG: hypothetical protein BWK76_03455 [Desulfobulbaceae bacterium A2]
MVRRLLRWCYHGIRCLLAGVFIVSGAGKLMDPQHFSLIIESYGLIPDPAILPVALLLSLLELIAGLGLLLDLRWSLGTITALLILFMLILGYGLYLGLDVDCGCFAAGDPEGEAYHSLRPALYRDALLLLAIVFLLFWQRYAALTPLSLRERYHTWQSWRRTR